MSYTPEELAIRQYLSKPLSGGYACGCVGTQPIKNDDEIALNFELKIKSYDNNKRKEVIQAIRQYTGLPLIESREHLDQKNVFGFEDQHYCSQLKNQLEAVGVQCEVIKNEVLLYPYCPCAMQKVMEVEGNFYEVTENRSPDGVTHKAQLLGPVGGPYNISHD